MTPTQKALLAATIAALAVVGIYEARQAARLGDESRSFQQDAGQLGEARLENERLSNLIVQAKAAQGLASNQFRELLRLRAEVGLLRGQSNELTRLREENRQLRSGLTTSQEAKSRKMPPEVPPQNIFPKESWTFGGFSTPEATVQSFFWAQLNGDTRTLSNCFSLPEEGGFAARQFETKPAGEIAYLDGRSTNLTGYRIYERTNFPAGQVGISIWYDGLNIVRRPRFDQIGSEWKMAPGLQKRPKLDGDRDHWEWETMPEQQ